jgi:hypothetical protein
VIATAARIGQAMRLLLVLATATAVAQDNPSAAARVEEDSMAAARRDLELIKTSRDSAVQPRSDLPHVNVPPLHATSPETPNRQQVTRELQNAETPSATWLLDAMEQGRGEGRRDRERETSAKGRLDPAMAAGTRAERQVPRPSGDRARPDEPKRTEAAINPFAQYLAGWMSPQDYALLAPTLQKSPAEPPSTAGATTPFGSAGADAGLLLRAGVSPGVSSQAPGQPVSRSSAAENPYLQALVLPAASSPVPAGMPAPPPPMVRPGALPAAPVIASPAPPTRAPRSGIPDFVRPLPDEGQYKHIKRF